MSIDFTNGNMSEVYYKNNKIYRKMKPYSKTLHRLLKHLEEKGIDFIPKVIEIDNNKNEEILSFVAGETLGDNLLVNNLEEKVESLKLMARLLRKFHNATLDFEVREEDNWFLEYKGELEKEVICHNDIAPYNVTFIENKPVGIIDFDTACPAPRIWDVAYCVYRFVPLSRIGYNETLDKERKLLISEFLKEYGMFTNEEILNTLILRLQALIELFDEECTKGNEAFIKMRDEGHKDFYIEEKEFIKSKIDKWK